MTAIEAVSDFETFARTQIEFATWHPACQFGEVEAVLHSNEGSTACGLTLRSADLGAISVGALGSDRFEALARAASFLEEEVNARVLANEAVQMATVLRPAARSSLSLGGHAL